MKSFNVIERIDARQMIATDMVFNDNVYKCLHDDIEKKKASLMQSQQRMLLTELRDIIVDPNTYWIVEKWQWHYLCSISCKEMKCECWVDDGNNLAFEITIPNNQCVMRVIEIHVRKERNIIESVAKYAKIIAYSCVVVLIALVTTDVFWPRELHTPDGGRILFWLYFVASVPTALFTLMITDWVYTSNT
jgi:hypothetical protein